jgi:WD repeat and SOF domain-containing protein 1
MCGSDEGNIRMWKTVAWSKQGQLNFRQRQSLQYAEALKKKFKYHPEVKRIARHRHLPKTIYKERLKAREMIDSQRRKESNRRAHSKAGTVPIVPQNEKIVQETLQ